MVKQFHHIMGLDFFLPLRIKLSLTRGTLQKPYREAAQAEGQLEKANVNVMYQKSLRDDPQLASNPISRWRQKQTIKKQYAAEKAGRSAVNGSSKAAKEAVKKSEQAASFVARHRKGFAAALGIGLILAFLLNVVSSCSMMVEGVGARIASGSYAASEETILDAEAAYTAKERELQAYLDSFRSTHSYDEYTFHLDEIHHDPYVLTAILSAMHPGEWTLQEVMGTLNALFEKQYDLTVDVDTETRYRDAQPYDYRKCTVTLKNFDLSHLPVYMMDEETLSMYALYMATLGNRPDLFPDSEYVDRKVTDYDIPPEALQNETFGNMIAEAEKYLGYPYVWGGSSPSTSFDCSGFVSWVINHCGNGWNVGRLSAQGLYNVCTPVSRGNARPGDLVFFKGTYDTPGISHVGIYVGNNRMIHCGDPITYANLNTNYWQTHFYTYGRLR